MGNDSQHRDSRASSSALTFAHGPAASGGTTHDKNMHKRILFVYPPYFSHSHERRILAGSEELTLGAPLGLMYLSAFLKAKGFVGDIEILDFMAMIYRNRTMLANGTDYIEAPVAQYLQDFSPDIVAISVNFSISWRSFVKIATKVRQIAPHATIVAGGGHSTFAFKEILQSHLADYVIRGEGEYAFYDLISALGTGRESLIEGVFDLEKAQSGRSDDEVGRSFDFNEFTMPDWDLVDTETYISKNKSFRYVGGDNDIFAQIVSSRGCPYRCIFCAGKNAYATGMRHRPVSNIVAEIEYLQGRFGITGIVPEDDMFLVQKSRSFVLLGALAGIPEKVKVGVRNGLSVNALDEDIIEAMIKANITNCSIAIDGGTTEIQTIIKKNCPLDKARDVIRYSRDRGIETCTNMMIGHYGETRAMIEEAIEYTRGLETDWLNIGVAVPLPGSEMYLRLCEDGVIKNSPEFWNNDFERGELDINGMSGEEITDIRQDTYFRSNYYSNKNLEQGRYERALLYFTRRCELKPGDLFSHAYRAECLFRMGRKQEGESLLPGTMNILRTESYARDVFQKWGHLLPERVVTYLRKNADIRLTDRPSGERLGGRAAKVCGAEKLGYGIV